MFSRTQVQIALAIAVVVWAAMLFVEGVTLDWSYLKPFQLAVGTVILFFVAFDRFLWRWGLVARVIHRPVLRGTWKGTLTSTWIDPTTNAAVPPISVYLVVRQTYTTIAMSLVTPESSSVSLVGSLDVPKNGVATATSTYRNTPRMLIQDRSRIHHGALMLEVHGEPPTRLSGCYWTDRDTKGEITLERRSPNLHSDFASADAGSYFP